MPDQSAAGPSVYCSRCGAPTSASAQFCQHCGAPLPAVAAAPSPIMYVPAAGVAYAGFWIRVLAAIIDWLIVVAASFPISMMFGLSAFPVRRMGPENLPVIIAAAGASFVLRTVLAWLYEAFMTSSSRQATIGKIAVGIKVSDSRLQRISFARATGRHFAKILSAMLLFIGFIMVAFTERKQGLHDMIADTVVTKA